MSRRAHGRPLTGVSLDPSGAVPLYRQLYGAIRARILAGQLASGEVLPSTRTLAHELCLARITVVEAIDQLVAEGYLETRPGSGTFVAAESPDFTLSTQRRDGGPPTQREVRQLSLRSQQLQQIRFRPGHVPPSPQPFQICPDLDAFPDVVWSRLYRQIWRSSPRALLSYSEAGGFAPLREALARHLGMARGVQCEPTQVIVVGGAQAALDLAARVLLNPGDLVWVEDPGYPGVRGAAIAAGATLQPIPVDREGMQVQAVAHQGLSPRLIAVTPSHQYPLGATMSLSRRRALLALATQVNAWIVEDDYDSEFRYVGRPVDALYSLDPHQRVIYIGTFSKVLFSGLRLGYLVVPADLVPAFTAMKEHTSRQSGIVEEMVVARFIAEGFFAAHIRRMRKLYAERLGALIAMSRRELDGLLTLESGGGGMQVVGWLPDGVDDQLAAARAAEQGVFAQPLSAYSLRHRPPPGLLLGFTGFGEPELSAAISRLGVALKKITP